MFVAMPLWISVGLRSREAELEERLTSYFGEQKVVMIFDLVKV
jgi:hypothetical protein